MFERSHETSCFPYEFHTIQHSLRQRNRANLQIGERGREWVLRATKRGRSSLHNDSYDSRDYVCGAVSPSSLLSIVVYRPLIRERRCTFRHPATAQGMGTCRNRPLGPPSFEFRPQRTRQHPSSQYLPSSSTIGPESAHRSLVSSSTPRSNTGHASASLVATRPLTRSSAIRQWEVAVSLGHPLRGNAPTLLII